MRRFITWLVLLAALAFLAPELGMSKPKLPDHRVHSVTSLAPRTGKRVELRAEGGPDGVSDEECRALIDEYREQGTPDGQVAVRVDVGNDTWETLCVENFDGNPLNLRSTAEALQRAIRARE